MAQATEAGLAAGDWRSAIAAFRGAGLAVHAAAGLAIPLDTETLRLARAAEGILRAAAARLEACARAARRGGGPAPPAADKDKGKEKVEKGQQGKEKPAKGTHAVDADTAMDDTPGKRKRTRRRKRGGTANIGSVPAAPAEARDDWADSASVVTSHSKSVVEESFVTLFEGHECVISGLISKPQLTGVIVTLTGFDWPAGRWICASPEAGQIRLKPANLTPAEELLAPAWRSVFLGGTPSSPPAAADPPRTAL